MHIYDDEGFALREPTAKQTRRVKKHPIGIHERWSGDGHDKLYQIGFPIWGTVDDGTSHWLGGWIVPSNRTGVVVAYLFLCLVEKYGGMLAIHPTLANFLLVARVNISGYIQGSLCSLQQIVELRRPRYMAS